MRHPIFLKIWGVAIIALGLWHVVSWRQDLDPNKDDFTLAVGIFCLLVGVIVVAMNFDKFDKRKDN